MSAPPDRRFWGLIWQSFLIINGPLCGVGGVIVSWIAWAVAKDVTITVPVLTAVVMVFLITCATLGHAYYTAHRAMLRAAPGVLRVMRPSPPHTNAIATILLEPSDLFALAVQVSVFEYRSEVERCIGVGRVFIIQEDGRAQVVLERAYEGMSALIEELFAGNREALSAIRVRPFVFVHDLDNLPARKDGQASGVQTTPAGVA
jgi:hypothetical protein